MIINDVLFNADLFDILTELQRQLKINRIDLIHDIKDSPENIMITCPYHKDGKERKPSAGISKKTGVFHCFTCGEIHSLQEVISYCFGKNDILGTFGWNWLLKNFATISVEQRRSVKIDFSRAEKHEVNKYIDEQELDSYREYHPYMWKRKMTKEVVEQFDIGYDAKSKCITFPVRDIDGHTLFIARRSTITKFFNYPVGADKPVYGLYELYQLENFPKEIIICESMIDAITCYVYGKPAVALNGLGTELQFEQLNKLPCRKFILATDNDEAGLNARLRLKANIKNKLITEFIFPKNRKDINDLTKEEFLALQEVF